MMMMKSLLHVEEIIFSNTVLHTMVHKKTKICFLKIKELVWNK